MVYFYHLQLPSERWKHDPVIVFRHNADFRFHSFIFSPAQYRLVIKVRLNFLQYDKFWAII